MLETGYVMDIIETVEGMTVTFNKDVDVVTIETPVDVFKKAYELVVAAYIRADRDFKIHGIPVSPELIKLREIYETANNMLKG